MSSKRTLTGHPKTDEAGDSKEIKPPEPPKVKLPAPGTKPRLPQEKAAAKLAGLKPPAPAPPGESDADAVPPPVKVSANNAGSDADDGDEEVVELDDNEVLGRVERELAAPPRLLGGTQPGLPPPSPPPELPVVQRPEDAERPATETNVLMPQGPDRKRQALIIGGAAGGLVLLVIIIAATMNSGVPKDLDKALAAGAAGSGSAAARDKLGTGAGTSGAANHSDKAAEDKAAADKAAADKAAADKAAADNAAADKAAADQAAADKAAADKAAADQAAAADKAAAATAKAAGTAAGEKPGTATSPAASKALPAVLAQARFFLEKRKCRKALAALQEKRDEGSGQWQLLLGRTLVCRRRYPQALAAFRKALDLDVHAKADPALVADLGRIARRRSLQRPVAQLLVSKVGRHALDLLIAGASHRDRAIREMCVAKVVQLGAAARVKWASTLGWDLRQRRSCEERRQAVTRVPVRRDRRLLAVLKRARRWKNACAYREIEAAIVAAGGAAKKKRRRRR